MMLHLTKKLLTLAAFVALSLAVAPAAYADDFVEVGDAGQTPGMASATPGVNPLTGIVGTFTAGATHADVYRIFIANPATFSATTIGGTTVDTQLFLFTTAGLGIVGNDDFGLGVQSGIGAGFAGGSITGALAAGEYLLAITQFDIDPINAAGLEIFTDAFSGAQTPILGRGAFTGFSAGGGTGTYRIALTGANHVAGGVTAVPEPATMCCSAQAWLASWRRFADGVKGNRQSLFPRRVMTERVVEQSATLSPF